MAELVLLWLLTTLGGIHVKATPGPLKAPGLKPRLLERTGEGNKLTKDVWLRLYDKLGRNPTDDEIADEHARMIENAMLQMEK